MQQSKKRSNMASYDGYNSRSERMKRFPIEGENLALEIALLPLNEYEKVNHDEVERLIMEELNGLTDEELFERSARARSKLHLARIAMGFLPEGEE